MIRRLSSALVRDGGLAGNLPALLAATFLSVAVLAALLAPILPIADPLAIDTTQILGMPSAEHPLGTDELGRDILARIIYGGRISLGVAFAAVLLAGVLGTITGVTIAFLGGAPKPSPCASSTFSYHCPRYSSPSWRSPFLAAISLRWLSPSG